MYSKEQLRRKCAEMLKELRLESGLSKAAIAEKLWMDDHTWARYESGQSAPDVPDFVWIYDQMGRDILGDLLRFLYPQCYEGLSPGSDITALREAISHFFLSVASDRTVREWAFLMFGGHGSNPGPQMQEFTMIDHLPMKDRVTIAQLVNTLWEMAQARGELVCCEHIMPDVEMFREGVLKGTDAAKDGKNAYIIAAGGQEQ
ncbi:MAG: helix-turn-helix transcriptional regulator [Gemmiger sp.]|nr:helix-turn-helix transcriptional regulator [Gemmiger sp.]